MNLKNNIRNILYIGFALTGMIILSCNLSSKEVEVFSNADNADGTPEIRFQDEVAAFQMQDSVYGIDHKEIVFTGSSSIRMWKSLEDDMVGLDVVNRGFGGSTLKELHYYSEDLIYKYKPQLVVVYCGENDISEGASALDAYNAFKVFHEEFQRKLPESEMIYVSMKPSISRWDIWQDFVKANDLISEYCSANNRISYLDISEAMINIDGTIDTSIFIEDGLHMNESGYAIWTDIIHRTLTDLYVHAND